MTLHNIYCVIYVIVTSPEHVLCFLKLNLTKIKKKLKFNILDTLQIYLHQPEVVIILALYCIYII